MIEALICPVCKGRLLVKSQQMAEHIGGTIRELLEKVRKGE